MQRKAMILFRYIRIGRNLPQDDCQKSTAIMLSNEVSPKGRQLYERLISVIQAGAVRIL